MKPRAYFVYYNGKYIAEYKSVRACLNFINRKGLQDDYNNVLRIVNTDGDMYHTVLGTPI